MELRKKNDTKNHKTNFELFDYNHFRAKLGLHIEQL